MPSKFSLSNGALRIVMRGGKVDEPVMQVLDSKKYVARNAEKEGIRLLLSDGKDMSSFVVVIAQYKHIIPKHSIIKLVRYITSVVEDTSKGGDRLALVILDMELLQRGEEVGCTIGDPIDLEDQPEEAVPTTKKATRSGSVNLQDQPIRSISGLSSLGKWVIKARILNKSAIRTWPTSSGEGKMFDVHLIDASGEIRLTAFHDAVDKYYDFIQIDKVYYFSECHLKSANKNFSTLKNDFEMTIGFNTVIQECKDVTKPFPTLQFDFISIDKVASMDVGSFVDVIGVCKCAGVLQTFKAKSTGKEMKKRELTLIDISKTAVTLTLWGRDAEIYDYSFPVIAVKGARVGDFGGGKYLSSPGSAIFKYNPDILEAFIIRRWYDNVGRYEDATNISVG